MVKRFLPCVLCTCALFLAGCAGTTGSTSSGTTNNSPSPTAPSISTPPVNQSVTVGQSATFTVVATGTPPMTYQWQQAGVNIAGATAATYTTNSTSTADNGSTFDVVVSNAAGTVTSPIAALTVTGAQGVSAAAAVRFLEQSSFGPTSAQIAQVQQLGFVPFITAQFTAPMSTYPDPASTVTSLLPTQQVLFTNALTSRINCGSESPLP